ncbi:MAG: hypothetical protein RR626_04545 [Anaerovoracaceae bacterium]
MRKFIVVSMLLLFLGLSLFPTEARGETKRLKVELTQEEQEFIQENPKVTVTFSPDNYPYSSFEGRQPVGIFPEIVSAIEYETGLQFDVLHCKDYEDYIKVKTSGGADLVFSTKVSEEMAEQWGYYTSEPFLAIPYSKLRMRTKPPKNNFVGVLEPPSLAAQLAKKIIIRIRFVTIRAFKTVWTH